MNKKKVIMILLAITLVTCSVITGCGKKSNSIMPIVDITMKTTNDDLKEAFGDKYDDSEFDDGKTVLNTAFKDIKVTVHITWEGKAIEKLWLEAVTNKDNYDAFEKEITDFYSDLKLENQADVVENGMTTYMDMDISYIHFIDQGNTFLYIGDAEAEKEETSGKSAS
ncbi:MAG: hypothetical protein K2J90_08140 [Lachnospiraceae bacterium]|nr:hypothetical protein [Lachnospiraceae bacterium]